MALVAETRFDAGHLPHQARATAGWNLAVAAPRVARRREAACAQAGGHLGNALAALELVRPTDRKGRRRAPARSNPARQLIGVSAPVRSGHSSTGRCGEGDAAAAAWKCPRCGYLRLPAKPSIGTVIANYGLRFPLRPTCRCLAISGQKTAGRSGAVERPAARAACGAGGRSARDRARPECAAPARHSLRVAALRSLGPRRRSVYHEVFAASPASGGSTRHA